MRTEGIQRRLRQPPEEIEGSTALTKSRGAAEGFRDEVFCTSDCFNGCVTENEEAEESGGEGAAGAVGGGGVDVLANEAVDLPGWKPEDVGGLRTVSGGGDDAEVRVTGGECAEGSFGVSHAGDGEIGESGELGPVGGDPGNGGEKLLVESFEGFGWKKLRAGAGAEDGVKDDARVQLASL